MEKSQNKRNKTKIDEEYVMSLMAEGVQNEGIQESLNETPKKPINEEVIKDRIKEPVLDKLIQKKITRVNKNIDVAYDKRFLNVHSMKKRGDKSIYIRQEYHERLSRIVQVIGKDKIPLYAYLDNILEHHFELFEQTITDNFNEKYKPIF